MASEGESVMHMEGVAKILSRTAHAGQVDKANEDYFSGHLTRVASTFKDPTNRTAAWLHDIVEDTQIDLRDLLVMGFPNPIVIAVDRLSRRRFPKGKEDYGAYLDRIKAAPPPRMAGTDRIVARQIAIAVKTADLEDHLRDSRHIDESLYNRYVNALAYLTKG